MGKFFWLFASLALLPVGRVLAQHAAPDGGKALGVQGKASADSIRARTVNAFISHPSQQYRPEDFSKTNESQKISLKMSRPAEAGTIFPEYGSLAIDGVGPVGIDGSPIFLHYNSIKDERDGRDAWGEPQSICSIVVFAARWKEHCIKKYGAKSTGPCTLQLGDISLPHRERKENGRCDLGHRSHYNGNCVDVRPVSPKKLIAGEVTKKSDRATVKRTQEALDFAVMMGGVNPIWQSAHHYDHFHVCFPLAKTRDRDLDAKIKKGPLAGCYGLEPVEELKVKK